MPTVQTLNNWYERQPTGERSQSALTRTETPLLAPKCRTDFRNWRTMRGNDRTDGPRLSSGKTIVARALLAVHNCALRRLRWLSWHTIHECCQWVVLWMRCKRHYWYVLCLTCYAYRWLGLISYSCNQFVCLLIRTIDPYIRCPNRNTLSVYIFSRFGAEHKTREEDSSLISTAADV